MRRTNPPTKREYIKNQRSELSKKAEDIKCEKINNVVTHYTGAKITGDNPLAIVYGSDVGEMPVQSYLKLEIFFTAYNSVRPAKKVYPAIIKYECTQVATINPSCR